MLYVKNMSRPHRLLRLLLALLGAGLSVAGLWGHALMLPAGLVLLTLAVTGLVGWCPMCAVIGRARRDRPTNEKEA